MAGDGRKSARPRSTRKTDRTNAADFGDKWDQKLDQWLEDAMAGENGSAVKTILAVVTFFAAGAAGAGLNHALSAEVHHTRSQLEDMVGGTAHALVDEGLKQVRAETFARLERLEAKIDRLLEAKDK